MTTADVTPAMQEPAPTFGGLCVLIVEDEPTHRRILSAQLRGLGVTQILEATDGDEALETLARNPQITLVISDLMMPRLDGLELLCQHAKSDHPASFAIYSAMDRQLLACMQLMARERALNFVGVLVKPASRADIVQLLERDRQSVILPSRKPLPIVTQEERNLGLTRGEFVPFFQPKVRFRDRKIVGCESLARWQHPVHGILPPSLFIDQFEAEGKLGELTEVLMSSSIEAAARWRAAGRTIPVSINLSLSFLSAAGTADRISSIAARHNVPPELVLLEITENVAMSDVGTCLENIARLRLRGFRFSIDDFGVGYSSLQQLVRIPFDEIKLDRSFVSGVVPNSRSAMMLEAAVAIATKLQMTSVAEGIETQAEWDFLADLGCNVAQGYFVARPLSESAFDAWAIKNWV